MGRLTLAAGATLAALSGLASPALGSEPRAALARAFYDFEVAGYCGLVSEPVGRGFRREVERLLVGAPLDPEALDRLRGRAWQDAHAEWQNRGLGGFRGWCANEGRAAARRFLESPPGSP